jgi:ribulose-phosphate 3-epimerase
MKSILNYSSTDLLISPSALAADFANLETEVNKIADAGCELLHLDIMDGHFVPNLTLGPPVINSLRSKSNLIFDAHLMITDPLKYISSFINAGSDHITFHIESDGDPLEIIQQIKKHGATAGISIKPNTPVSDIVPFLAELDLILVMTVEPGFGGQSFMKEMMPKVAELRQLAKENGYTYHIQVDGGVDQKTIADVTKAGANVIVAGTAVFRHPDGVDSAVQQLRTGSLL